MNESIRRRTDPDGQDLIHDPGERPAVRPEEDAIDAEGVTSEEEYDIVEDQSDSSFPASDPPSWTNRET